MSFHDSTKSWINQDKCYITISKCKVIRHLVALTDDSVKYVHLLAKLAKLDLVFAQTCFMVVLRCLLPEQGPRADRTDSKHLYCFISVILYRDVGRSGNLCG